MTHLILYPQPPRQTQRPTPLRINLPLEIERMLLIRQVPGRDNQRKARPKQEVVHGEKGAVVEDDPGESEERGE